MKKIGLIAGNGSFPLAFARAAKQKGLAVIARWPMKEPCRSLRNGWTASSWSQVGQLGKLIKVFRTMTC
jgi:DUF1009 family protein